MSAADSKNVLKYESITNCQLVNGPNLVYVSPTGVNMARVELVEALQDSGGRRGASPGGPYRCRFSQHGDRIGHALFALQSK